MIGVIQMKKPTAESADYYLNFYNMYNLLQINDAIIFNVFEESVDNFHLTTESLLDNINTDNYAKKLIEMFYTIGVYPPENLVKMNEENRGTDTSFAYALHSRGTDLCDWFRKTNEFLQLYAIFEQALKDFLLQKGCHSVSESNAIEKLINQLHNLTPKFFEIFSFKTFGIIENVKEAEAVWAYYTKLRNCIAHAGGRITQKIIDGFNGIRSNCDKIFTKIEKKEWLRKFFLLEENDDYRLFGCTYSLDDIICVDNNSLNFFRMFCVFVIETLDEIFDPAPVM